MILFLLIAALSFERFVGLGNCCLTRNQINRHLTQRYSQPVQAFGGGQLLDWVIVHDYEKLIEAIETDFIDFFQYEHLYYSLRTDQNYDMIRDAKYQITWNHLFERPLDPHNIPDKKEKIGYLIEKFRGLKNYRTLYIISNPFEGQPDGTEWETYDPDLETLERLRRALKRHRGNNNFKILYCPLHKQFSDTKDIYVREIVNPVDKPFWEGDDRCWDRVLRQFSYSGAGGWVDDQLPLH